MAVSLDIRALRSRLREADAWCASQDAVGDGFALWTPGLLDVTPASEDEDALWHRLYAYPEATVRTVLDRRAGRLAGPGPVRGGPPDGRILACIYGASLACGASPAASEGFVDAWDIPAWDTWIGLVPASASRAADASLRPVLLAWVPRSLTARANKAVLVNPTEAVKWLDEWNPDLGRALLSPT